MRPFAYTRPASLAQASQIAGDDTATLIAGGTNLVDLMKLQVETPGELADINRIGFAQIEDTDDGGLSIGALATNPYAVLPSTVKTN